MGRGLSGDLTGLFGPGRMKPWSDVLEEKMIELFDSSHLSSCNTHFSRALVRKTVFSVFPPSYIVIFIRFRPPLGTREAVV